MRKFSEEYDPPAVAEKLGWWSDGAVRVWRSPSYSRPGDWEDGTCRAVCHSWRGRNEHGQHDAPHEGCTCGIYGSLSYADLLSQFRYYAEVMVAVIAAEGITIIGDRGLKTQFARVVAYWVAPEPIYRDVAARQFQDAERFDSPLEMMLKFGIALLPPPRVEARYVGPEWWTSKPE